MSAKKENLKPNQSSNSVIIGLLIILIDVSGSIKVKELNMFSSVTYKSLKYFSKVLILVHNINIIQTITFEKDEFIKYMDFINNIGFLKGGGTSHYDCYEYIQKEIWNDKELKDKFSMVISLTDGFSDINSCLNNRNFTWMKSVPTTFIISSKKKFENKELNTNSILINPDE
jgi:predicted metal-dependent peptidase